VTDLYLFKPQQFCALGGYPGLQIRAKGGIRSFNAQNAPHRQCFHPAADLNDRNRTPQALAIQILVRYPLHKNYIGWSAVKLYMEDRFESEKWVSLRNWKRSIARDSMKQGDL